MELKKENCKQRTNRKTKNAWIRCKAACKKSDVAARIMILESERVARKRLFGVQYMDLFEQEGTGDEVLQRCVDLARDDLEKIETKIDELKQKLNRIEEKARNKLVPKPGSGSSIEQPSVSLFVPPQQDEAPPIPSSSPPPPYSAETGIAENDDHDDDANSNNDEPERVAIDEDTQKVVLTPSAPDSKYDDEK